MKLPGGPYIYQPAVDHRLPLGASFAATLAMLLKKEREQDRHGRTPPFCGWNSAMPPDRRNWPRNGSRSFGPRDVCPSLGSRVKNDRSRRCTHSGMALRLERLCDAFSRRYARSRGRPKNERPTLGHKVLGVHPRARTHVQLHVEQPIVDGDSNGVKHPTTSADVVRLRSLTTKTGAR
jgi:hypothetical protein